MAKIIFEKSGEEIEVEDGSPLTSPCENEGVTIACGEGFCGACIVHVEGGNLSKPTQAEIDFLGEEGVKKERMACQCKLLSGTVKIRT